MSASNGSVVASIHVLGDFQMKLFCLSRCLLIVAIATSAALTVNAADTSLESLQTFVDKHELAGAVALVADKDKTLALESVGFADIEARKPMRADTMFWIASQSKPMTAVAVMMLVDE